MPSFAGSTCNIIQNCQDALAINCYYQGADLFLKATASPGWPEIKNALFKEQTATNQPDLTCYVFHLKMAQLIKNICNDGIIKCTVAYVTIEFQK